MSLESKIENLTAAVQALTELIQKNVTYNATLIESSPAATTPAAKTETPKEAPATTPAVTVEKLHELCMEKSRANPDNRDKIKAILATYNAKTLKTLSTDDIPAVFNKVNAL